MGNKLAIMDCLIFNRLFRSADQEAATMDDSHASTLQQLDAMCNRQRKARKFYKLPDSLTKWRLCHNFSSLWFDIELLKIV